MFFEEKIIDINKKLEIIKGKRVAVWCAGVHTDNLLKYTKLMKYNIVFLIDGKANEFINQQLFGKQIVNPSDVDYKLIDAIVVSSFKYQSEIANYLEKIKFCGDIITLYTDYDEGEFYLLPYKNTKHSYSSGNFSSWDEACNYAIGYNESSILEKVLNSTKAVMEGKACYERDSVLFYENSYNFRLISIFGLLARTNKAINIVDVGGSLGSEYWRNREMLYLFDTEFTWNVVEQENFVQIGNKDVKNNELSFCTDISQLSKNIDIALLSGVLQYLPDWKKMLNDVKSLNVEYILIERQSVSNETRICIQHVGDEIYSASYPKRIIPEKEIVNFLDDKYVLVTKYDSEIDGIYYVDGIPIINRGYLFKLK